MLAACGANELLPQNPELPADVFTACLTTPIKVSSWESLSCLMADIHQGLVAHSHQWPAHDSHTVVFA